MGSEQVERFWTLAHVDDSKKSLACDLVNTGQDLEVRCHCGDTVLRAERVSSLAGAMNLCEAWKASYRGQGWIEPSE